MSKKLILPVAAGLLVGLLCEPALAATTITFVSVNGNDANDCAAPSTACRSFQRAHAQTLPNGEIKALTPGDFRPLTISKSITVTGVEGSGVLGAAGSQAILVGAGTGVVNIRNLTLTGGNVAARGIRMLAASSLSIQNCKVDGFLGVGVDIVSQTKFLIEDTTISNNPAGIGVQITSGLPYPNIAEGVIRRASFLNNAAGLYIPNGRATVSDSMFTGQLAAAVQVGLSGKEGVIRMERNDITGNGVGVRVESGSFAYSGRDNFILSNGTNYVGEALIQWGKQ